MAVQACDRKEPEDALFLVASDSTFARASRIRARGGSYRS